MHLYFDLQFLSLSDAAILGFAQAFATAPNHSTICPPKSQR